MILLPPNSTPTDTRFPYSSLFRSDEQVVVQRFEVTLGRDDAWPIEFIYPLAALRGIEPLMGARVHDELKISDPAWRERLRSEEHTAELQSLMRISNAVICLKKINCIIIKK